MSIPSRFGWFLGLSLGLCLMCAPVSAQDGEGFDSPSESQLQLNEEGSKAFREGDYEVAARRFEASLLVGELNITYLNLGRAYFKLGQCKKARQAYAKVRKAPRVRQPPPETIMSRLNEYIVELEEGCEEGGGEVPVCPEGQVFDGQGCVPSPPVDQSSCPAGQSITEDTAGQCCWVGQVWNGDKCIGLPKTCPVGSLPSSVAQSCVCETGKARDKDGGHCCWVGQVWSSSQSTCVGVVKSCPKGFLASEDGCSNYARNAVDLELTLLGIWLRYERMLTEKHAVSLTVGLNIGFDTDDFAGVFSPAAGSELSSDADGAGTGVSLGYKWHWAGGLGGGFLGGNLGVRRHDVGFFELSNDEGEFAEAGVVDRLATVTLLSGVAGWRWIWPSGMSIETRFGGGFFRSSIELECDDENFFGNEELCQEFEGEQNEAGFWIDTGVSFGFAF